MYELIFLSIFRRSNKFGFFAIRYTIIQLYIAKIKIARGRSGGEGARNSLHGPNYIKHG